VKFDFVAPKVFRATDGCKTHAERELPVGNQIVNEHLQFVCVCPTRWNGDIHREVLGAAPSDLGNIGVAGLLFFIPTAIHHADGLILPGGFSTRSARLKGSRMRTSVLDGMMTTRSEFASVAFAEKTAHAPFKTSAR
jgi:hypothetical protein